MLTLSGCFVVSQKTMWIHDRDCDDLDAAINPDAALKCVMR